MAKTYTMSELTCMLTALYANSFSLSDSTSRRLHAQWIAHLWRRGEGKHTFVRCRPIRGGEIGAAAGVLRPQGLLVARFKEAKPM